MGILDEHDVVDEEIGINTEQAKKEKIKVNKILTTKEVQEQCFHKKVHVSSFSNRILVCDECLKKFDRYRYRKIKCEYCKTTEMKNNFIKIVKSGEKDIYYCCQKHSNRDNRIKLNLKRREEGVKKNVS